MKVIGVTGSFGTGKTFVASIFKSLGAKVLDADSIAHRCIGRGKTAYKKLIKIFGNAILNGNGNIDRRKLAQIVFSDKNLLKEANRIIHPEVIRIIKNSISGSSKDAVIIIDAPLLIEADLRKDVDYLVVVKASRAKQVKRCTHRFCINKKEVLARIENQMPLKVKVGLADFVIDNNGTMSGTRKQVREIWRRIEWR